MTRDAIVNSISKLSALIESNSNALKVLNSQSKLDNNTVHVVFNYDTDSEEIIALNGSFKDFQLSLLESDISERINDLIRELNELNLQSIE